ncbi:hypothetical protein QFX18_19270 [Saccharophagus degradans]|uniref:hypothetical protein n=1 Tax=Saccharophagus degradans TaxID=86304 RepID=UPI0024780489|nr:hypothetical protein [Saccharophagus degradans]WGO98151.1 hypothetical protein QFX18_19270 [Saccharophagus degradans]
MKIVEFNGFGAPKLEGVKDGDILVLFKPQESIEIVKLKILPPNEYGPELTHAENSPEFESELKKIIEIDHPQLENTDRHWVLTCPENIIRKVKF